MSTAFHPQTDRASERSIRTITQILRSMILPDQKDWIEKVPMVEFVINLGMSGSTGFAPFKLTYGYMPRMAQLWFAPLLIISLINTAAFVHACSLEGSTKYQLQLCPADSAKVQSSSISTPPDLDIVPPEYRDYVDVFSKVKCPRIATTT